MQRANHQLVTIVGGGVIGLSTAVELGARGFKTQVLSAGPLAETTSAKAGAFWYPFHAAPRDRVLPLARHSYDAYLKLCWQRVPGLRMVDAVELHRTQREPSPWARVAQALRPAPSSLLRPEHRCGYLFRTVAIECARYLDWLSARARAQGTIFKQRALAAEELEDVPGPVVIAAGLGSRDVAADDAVYGVQGRLLVTQSRANQLLLIDEDHPHGPRYVIPHARHTVLGTNFEPTQEPGPKVRGLAETNPEPILSRIESDCRALSLSVGGIGPRIGRRVAVRPCRGTLRLEAEQLDGQLRVYNYGHGGAGFTLSWGCASEVARLLEAPLSC